MSRTQVVSEAVLLTMPNGMLELEQQQSSVVISILLSNASPGVVIAMSKQAMLTGGWPG